MCITERTQQLFLNYAAAGFIIAVMGYGVNRGWWPPSNLQNLLFIAASGLGIGHSLVFGARHLTSSRIQPNTEGE